MANDPPPSRNTRGRSTAALAGVPRQGTRQSNRSHSLPSRMRSSVPSNNAQSLRQSTKTSRYVPRRRSSSPRPSSPATEEPSIPRQAPHPLMPPPTDDLDSLMLAAALTVPEPLSNEPTADKLAQSLLHNPCLFSDEATTTLFKNFSVNSRLHEMKLEKIEERFFMCFRTIQVSSFPI